MSTDHFIPQKEYDRLQDIHPRDMCAYVWGEYDGGQGKEIGAHEQGAPATGATKRPHELRFITLACSLKKITTKAVQ
jgi:hypothetical protein